MTPVIEEIVTTPGREAVDDWRDLDDWSLARFRWLLRTRFDIEHPWRSKQLTPIGEWFIALFLAGRGWGKTRAGAEDVSDYARTHPKHRYALICETFGDGRDVMVEGESGILAVVPPSCIAEWNRSLGEILFINGAHAKLYTSERPDKLRGPQHHRAWGDEPAKWRHPIDTWDNLMFGLRLGDDPRVIITGTPKPTELVRNLYHRRDVARMGGSTYENRHNLAPQFIAEIEAKYEGKRLGQQEIHAVLLEDFEGALWRRAWIDATRVPISDIEDVVARLVRGYIGLDPSTWDPEMGDDPGTIAHGLETGIVAVAVDNQEPAHLYVVEDASIRGSTQAEWAQAAIDCYRRLEQVCPVQMVPERNIGASSYATVRQIDPTIKFYRDENGKIGVWSSKGKRVRAEPVSGLYEPPNPRMHHMGTFAELEGQLCGWDPTENWSPDRLDALVHAATAAQPWAHVAAGSAADLLVGSMR